MIKHPKAVSLLVIIISHIRFEFYDMYNAKNYKYFKTENTYLCLYKVNHMRF